MSETPSSNAKPGGLPPVTPPSFGFVAQLFVFPFLIVLVAVFAWLLFRYVTWTSNSPVEILRGLDNVNGDIRWRRAADLAQILKRREPDSLKLRSDLEFALGLAERLDQALTDLIAEEAKLAEQLKPNQAQMSEKELLVAWRRLDPHRDYVQFLSATMGDLVAPVGIPIIAKIAMRKESPDFRNILTRRQAIWTLGLMGDNRKEFHRLAPEKQLTYLEAMKAEANKPGIRGDCARSGLFHLDRKLADASDIGARADDILAKCAEDPDRFIRAQVALACAVWDGERIEPTLVALTKDTGFGTLVKIHED